MAITYVGGGQDDRGASVDLTPTLPTHATDDFCVALVFGDNLHTFSETANLGFTQLRADVSTNGFGRAAEVWYKKFTSASETAPVWEVSGGGAAHAVVLGVFRGVNTTTPFDTTEQYNDPADSANHTNPAITTANAGSAVILLHGNTSTSITVHGAPSGYTLGESIIDTTTMPAVAYLLNSGAAGTKTPGAWTNTGGDAGDDASLYTLALRDASAGAGGTIIPQSYHHLRQLRQ